MADTGGGEGKRSRTRGFTLRRRPKDSPDTPDAEVDDKSSSGSTGSVSSAAGGASPRLRVSGPIASAKLKTTPIDDGSGSRSNNSSPAHSVGRKGSRASEDDVSVSSPYGASMFIQDPSLSHEENTKHRREWEAERKMQMALTRQPSKEWQPDPSKSDAENIKAKREWEGEQKLKDALAAAARNKEAAAKQSELAKKKDKEKDHVNGFMERFTVKLLRRKGKEKDEVAGTSSSTMLRPGQSPAVGKKGPAHDVAAEYAQQYGVLTPQNAHKKRLQSEAEKSVNTTSQADSYLSRFLEEPSPKPKKKTHQRRNSDDQVARKSSVDLLKLQAVEETAGSRRNSRGSVLGRRLSLSVGEGHIPALDRQRPDVANPDSPSIPRSRQARVEELASPAPPVTAVSSDQEEESSSSTFEEPMHTAAIPPQPAAKASTKSGAKTSTKAGSKHVRRSTKRSPAKATEEPPPAVQPPPPVAVAPVAAAAPAASTAKKRVAETDIPGLLKLGAELGRGAFSMVYRATRVADGLEVAVKVVELTRLTPKQLAEIDAERSLLEIFHHPNVVNLLAIYETSVKLYMVLELLPAGDLFNKILQKGCFSERACKRIVLEIVEAVAAMHDLGIVHRDLKPENILCIEDEKTKQIDVKVADFGIAKRIGRERAKSTCGSPGYVAPEVIRGEEYSLAVDMFSLGAIVYVLLAGYPPFWGDDMKTIIAKNLNVEYTYADMYWAHISPAAKDFINRLICKEPEDRMTARDALMHPWLGAKKK